MAKRYTDTDIWKRQRWFKKLSIEHKIAFFYIKDMCDKIGIWKIDCEELQEDTGLAAFDLQDFVEKLNQEFDKINGAKKHKSRVKIINGSELWITGFTQFQYENVSTGKLSRTHVIGKDAVEKMKAKGLYEEAKKNRYIVEDH